MSSLYIPTEQTGVRSYIYINTEHAMLYMHGNLLCMQKIKLTL